ncbi:MAG: hypothetical protein E6J82_07255 [Deltaproteobacteria bacterium]|nr:MAG: hypothetical protein E6J82_07255 [Deltaproteobacteria bacterium]
MGAGERFARGFGRPRASRSAPPRCLLRPRCCPPGAARRASGGAAAAGHRDGILSQAGPSRRSVPLRSGGPGRARRGGARRRAFLRRRRPCACGRRCGPQGRRPLRPVLDRARIRRRIRPLLPVLRRPGGRNGASALSVGAHPPRVRARARIRGRAGRRGGRASRLHLHHRLGAGAAHRPRHDARDARLPPIPIRRSPARHAGRRASARGPSKQGSAGDCIDGRRGAGLRGAIGVQGAADQGAGDLDRARPRHLLAGGIHALSRLAARAAHAHRHDRRRGRQGLRAPGGCVAGVLLSPSPRARDHGAAALRLRRRRALWHPGAAPADAGRGRFADLHRSVASAPQRPGLVPHERRGSERRARLDPLASPGRHRSGGPARRRSPPVCDRGRSFRDRGAWPHHLSPLASLLRRRRRAASRRPGAVRARGSGSGADAAVGTGPAGLHRRQRPARLERHRPLPAGRRRRVRSVRVVGESLLEVKVGASLVPTLAQSFAITAALIFVVFLFVFRSATARVLAMIPSLFAILATFLGMRLFGASLNVATILIATTVLGTTENDQIHFFHHLHERDGHPLGDALAHALRVSGHAIVFATLINAAGFLALSVSSFPPLRQFGLVTSAAFILALIADFTALPAGLWIVNRRRRQGQPT